MISINIYEILIQWLNLIILLWLLHKFLTKPLSQFLQKRSESIQRNIEQSEVNRMESIEILNEHKKLLKDSSKKAREIRKNAEAASHKERQMVLDKAKKEAAGLLQNAKKELEQDIKKAKEIILNDISGLSIHLAQKLLTKSLDSKENQVLLNEFLKERKQ